MTPERPVCFHALLGRFDICRCGHVGRGLFADTEPPRVAAKVEAVYEFVEHLDDDELFTIGDVRSRTQNVQLAAKTVQLMEHQGLVRRIEQDAVGKFTVWQRAAPVGAS